MTRIRIALALIALGVLVPAGFLVWRALEGVSLQQRVQHEALAARVFDEMERELSRLLEAEEARPFAHYRFYASDVPGGPRSPLSFPPEQPFVIGYFQIDPDGSVSTPLRPPDLASARARGDWPISAEVTAVVVHIERLVVRYLARADGRSIEEAIAPALSQAPGSTVDLVGQSRLSKRAGEKKEATTVEPQEYRAYDALQQLNLAARDRAARKQKVVLPEPATAPIRSSSGFADSELEMVGEVEEIVVRAEISSATAQAAPMPLLDQVEQDDVESMAEPAKTVRITLDPMVGRALEEQHVVLVRTVLVGSQGYRQGLILDRAKLGAWLEGRVLGEANLAGIAQLHFAQAGPDHTTPAQGFAFQHRFVEPFDALAARLDLAPLATAASPAPIYLLAGLLLLVGGAGAFALYRMVAVTVEFAERRSNFVAAVSHELKTPLTAIRMYGEMLRDGLVDSEEKRDEYHHTITEESERLSRLIDNVLEFSQLEKGTRSFELHVGPLAPVLEEVVEKLQPHVRSAGFDLALRVEADLPSVRFDRDALLQVLFNLVDNALKYARAAADKRIVLEARRGDGGVEVAVRDFGPGVEARHLSRVFEPFFRGEDERTRTTKGTGIGLALVKELADHMGAAAHCANAPEGGFRVAIAFRA